MRITLYSEIYGGTFLLKLRQRLTHLIFVIDHVSKSLVVNYSDENVDLHLATVYTTVHSLGAVEVVPNYNDSKHYIILLKTFCPSIAYRWLYMVGPVV